VARTPVVQIVGAGLAGSEAAWQIASRGIRVELHEMRPSRPTAVHKTGGFAELVCSNSFRGDKLDNAVGLLKEEMRRLGSLVMRAAEASRVPAGAAAEPETAGAACGADDGQGDYLNCPFTREEYDRFYDALITAESATVHDFDNTQFFEGCLPIEVMAHRGRDTLRFGPMKPAGLDDPRTGRWPYAVVQLRQDTLAGDHYSLVGFQTQLKWGEQARVLRLIPGLEQAEFVRYGMVHRNTYVNGPTVLAATWQVRARPDLFLAGQVSGVEGYVESAASGLLAGINAARVAGGRPALVAPRTTAIGALAHYASHADPAHYQPTNITFGIMPPLDAPPRGKADRKQAYSARALDDLAAFVREAGVAEAPAGAAAAAR
jgi:methylenetetrahydrofolate--tRNA-(uracil-5-)-methyltransferase